MVSWLLNAHLHVLGADILWREILGNGFGLVSVLFAMQRRIAAWPIGMAGNVLLFTVFLGGVFNTPQDKDLYGQAGRQVMFFAAALYGWWRWRQNRRATGQPTAVAPHWAPWRSRLAIMVAAGVGVAALDPILAALGSFGALADSWIFMGSLLATVAMARGYTDFWVLWIGVDAVGVPLLLRAGYYPSALLYIVYGVVCVWGFAVWWKAQSAVRPSDTTVGDRQSLRQLDSATGRP